MVIEQMKRKEYAKLKQEIEDKIVKEWNMQQILSKVKSR